VRQLAAEFPFEVGRRGYAVGTAVLDATLPPADGLTTTAPVAMGDEGLERAACRSSRSTIPSASWGKVLEELSP